MSVINTTPHKIVLENGDIHKEYEPSGLIIRLDFKQKIIGELDGLPIIKNELVGHNLPIQKEGTILLVSAMILSSFPNRKDLVSPDTNNANRNEKGHIISVPAFVSN